MEQPRPPSEIGLSQPGNYLAGLIASADRDAASAEAYYREALRVDPRNPDLLERAFAAALSNGDEQTANALGERLLTRDPTDNLARLAIAVHEIEQGQLALARTHLASADGRPKDVTTTLLAAWCYAGKGELRGMRLKRWIGSGIRRLRLSAIIMPDSFLPSLEVLWKDHRRLEVAWTRWSASLTERLLAMAAVSTARRGLAVSGHCS